MTKIESSACLYLLYQCHTYCILVLLSVKEYGLRLDGTSARLYIYPSCPAFLSSESLSLLLGENAVKATR